MAKRNLSTNSVSRLFIFAFLLGVLLAVLNQPTQAGKLAPLPSTTSLVDGPGGVATDLALWVRADAGITQAGGAISQWTDQSSNAYQAVQPLAGSQPAWVTDTINFNPMVRFDGSNNSLRIAGGVLGSATHDDLNIYAVSSADLSHRSYLFHEAASPLRVVAHVPWSDGRIYWDAGNAGGANRLSAVWGGQFGTPNIWGLLYSTSSTANGRNQEIIRDGNIIAQDSSASAFTGTSSDLFIGSSNVLGDFHNGDLAELIVYTGNINNSEHVQIQSYLALKYGITLGSASTPVNYIASDGTIVWTGSVTYQHDVAGIARDDLSVFDQRQSKSINPSAIVTVENAGTFSTDLSYFVWGHNGANTNFDGVINGYFHMNRIWKASDPSGLGTLTFRIPDTTSATYLLVDADTDCNFTTGTPTAYPLTVSGSDLVATVDVPHNGCFTFAQDGLTEGPGGIINGLALWMKADAGITEVGGNDITQWLDMTGKHSPVLYNSDPDLLDGATQLVNFNPVVHFDSNDFIRWDGNEFQTGFTAGEVFIIGKEATPDTTNHGHLFDFGGASTSHYTFGDTRIYEDFGSAERKVWDPDNLGAGGLEGASDAILSGPSRNTTQYHVYNVLSEAGNWQAAFDGLVAVTDATNTTNFAGTPHLGARGGLTSNGGRIAEVLFFNRVLTTSERQQTNSYLALKYGLTLGNTSTPVDYVSASGTTVWAGSLVYQNDIAGIARDDTSLLDQRKSKSVNSGAITTVEHVGAFTTDESYFMWGHNGGNTNFDVVIGGYAHMNRVWQVSSNVALGSLNFSIPNTFTAFYMLVDTDADCNFATGSPTAYVLTTSSDGLTASANLSDGQCFTFAQDPPTTYDNAGNALYFAGIDEYVAIPDHPAFNVNTVTYEMWFWPETPITTTHFLIGKATEQLEIAVGATGLNSLRCTPTAGVAIDSAVNAFNTGQWTHVACVYNPLSSLAKIYVNGVDATNSVTGDPSTAITTSTDDLNIGRGRASNVFAFHGLIDEVRIWSIPRSLVQIEATMFAELNGTEGGLVAYYKMEDGEATNASDTTLTDLAGGDNSGTLIGIDATLDWHGRLWLPEIVARNGGLIISNTTFLQDNGDDILFAHDDTTGISTDDLPGGITEHWARTWNCTLVDTNSNGGQINIAFDFDEAGMGTLPTPIASDYKLMYRSGTSGDFTILASGNTLNSGQKTITFVNLEANTLCGQLTLGYLRPTVHAPGGVLNNLALWLRADIGAGTSDGDPVLTWIDQGQGRYDADAIVAPTYESDSDNSLNFNPILRFASAHRLRETALSVGPNISTFAVASPGPFGGYKRIINNEANFFFGVENNLFATFYGNGTTWDTLGNHAYGLNAGTFYILGSINDGINYPFVNGYSLPSRNNPMAPFNNGYDVGHLQGSSGAQPWDGDMAEIIIYNQALNSTDRQKIETYLALKYGLTLGDVITPFDYYLASDGSTVWVGNATYHHDIAGIVRDDISVLDQRKSKSMNNGVILTVEHSGTLTADRSYFIWGHNGNNTNFDTVVANYAHMNRIWKVADNNMLGAVTFSIPDSTRAMYMLVDPDSDCDFGTGIPVEYALTLIGNKLSTSADVVDGGCFTFAIDIPPAPGGVAGGLELWLKADGQITVDGTNSVTNWDDETGDHMDEGIVNTPNYIADAYNFNPTINFVDSYLYWNSQQHLSGATAGDIFYLLEGTSTHTSRGGFPSEVGGLGAPQTAEYDFSNGLVRDYFGSSIRHEWDPRTAPAGAPARDVLDPHIYNTLSSPFEWTAWFDGLINYTDVLSPATSFNGSISGRTLIGASNNSIFNGNISEVILYRRELTNEERNRVNSYLAIKYGLTLGTTSIPVTYTNSFGNVIWRGNATYQNNIAGIGRDDTADFVQTKSSSLNPDTLVTIENSGSFVADASYFIWGNNNGSLTFSESLGAQKHLSRIWHVNETGTVISVTVSVLSSTGAQFLLVDDDGNFTSGITVIPLREEGSNLVATFDFTDGQFFTFSRTFFGPGGVKNDLSLWLKANDGAGTIDGTSIDTWIDHSGGRRDLTQDTSTLQPTYQTNELNENPIVQFDGSDDYLERLFDNDLNPDEFTVLFVAQTTGGNGTLRSPITSRSESPNSGYFFYSNINNKWTFLTGDDGGLGSWQSTPSNTPSNNWSLVIGTYDTVDKHSLYVNGLFANSNTANYLANMDAPLRIGAGATELTTPQQYFNGDIAEMILYSHHLSDVERNQVESYLAIKYGLTLGDIASPVDYLNSVGATIWNGNIVYQNDIAGIARDDNALLDQPRSTSINSNAIVTIDHGETLSSDLSSLIWGNNRGETTFNVLVDNLDVMGRIWQVAELGTVDTVTLTIPITLSAQVLLVDNDTNFAEDATIIPLTMNGSELVATVDFTDGQYFTFGQVQATPGGVNNHLALWLKGDDGVIADGSNRVFTWVDQSGNGMNANEGGGGVTSRPTTNAGMINFNNVLTFSNDELSINHNDTIITDLGLNNSDYEIMVVAQSMSTSTQTLLSLDDQPNGINNENFELHLNNASGFRFIPRTDTYSDQGVTGDYTNGVAQLFRAQVEGNVSQTSVSGIAGMDTETPAQSNVDNYLKIGGRGDNTFPIEGEIAEIIIFNNALSTSERQKVNSYLALKYGITLGNISTPMTYTNSLGNTIWLGSATYQHDIAGIGRDDGSLLHQIKSTSVNNDALITINNGELIGMNQSSLIWGNNNGATTFSLSASGYNYMPRTWTVMETGTIGTISLSVPASTNATFILVDDDGNFSAGAMALPLIQDGEMLSVDVDLVNGQFFTLAQLNTAPGGVTSGLELWLKANSQITINGSNQVTNWDDQTGTHTDESIVGNLSYIPNAYNFNPAVGSDRTGYVAWLGQQHLSGASSAEAFYMLEGNSTHTTRGGFPSEFGGGGASVTSEYDFLNGQIYDYFGSSVRYNWDPRTAPAGGPARDVLEPHIYNTLSSSSEWTARFDGLINFSSISGVSPSFNSSPSGNTYVGSSHLSIFDGNMAEVVLYRRELTTNERARVDSYLAIKYGLTLGTNTSPINYISSLSTPVWIGNSVYQHDVAGIGRDDNSGLNQLKSKSTNTDALVTIEHVNSLTSDQSFLMWGNNNGTTTYSLATSQYNYMARHWQVSEVGTVGQVMISVPNSTQANLLLIDTDTDFSDATYIVLGRNDSLRSAYVDLNDGMYFTFGQYTEPVPGGVAQGIELWLKADAGITEFGGSVSQWTDQSPQGYIASQATATNQPLLSVNTINFNKTVQFDGNNDFLSISGGIFQDNHYHNVNMYAVTTASTIHSNILLSESVSSGQVSASTPWNSSHIFWNAGSVYGDYRLYAPWGGEYGLPNLWGLLYSTQTTVNGQNQEILRDNNILIQDQTALPFSGTGSDFLLATDGSSYHNGDIAELVVYSGRLNQIEHEKIQAYLAIKYGITLGTPSNPTDYRDSDGTIVWAGNTTYQNGIAGIARDDQTALDQRQSSSVNVGTIVTATHTGMIASDQSYFIWGHNTGGINLDVGAGPYRRMSRVWQVADNNGLGTVTFAIPASTNALYMLVDVDGDFSAGATEISLVNAGNTLTATVDIADGNYFTFGECNQAMSWTVYPSVSGNDILLSWTHNLANSAGYELYRSTSPYFTPNAGNLITTLPAGTESYLDAGRAGSTSPNYYYKMQAFNHCNGTSEPANDMAEFDFSIVPGS